MKRVVFIFILFGVIYSCKTTLVNYKGQKVIRNYCELNNKINDTVILSGTYSIFMEYTDFILEEKSNCFYSIDLNFSEIELNRKFERKLTKISNTVDCLNMTLKGVFNTGDKNGYGHLGNNNSELIVFEVINYGKGKCEKPRVVE